MRACSGTSARKVARSSGDRMRSARSRSSRCASTSAASDAAAEPTGSERFDEGESDERLAFFDAAEPGELLRRARGLGHRVARPSGGEQDPREGRARLGAKRRGHRKDLDGGAGLALGGVEIAGGSQHRREVSARRPREPAVTLGLEGFDRGAFDQEGLDDRVATGQDHAEVQARDGGDLLEVERLGLHDQAAEIRAPPRRSRRPRAGRSLGSSARWSCSGRRPPRRNPPRPRRRAPGRRDRRAPGAGARAPARGARGRSARRPAQRRPRPRSERSARRRARSVPRSRAARRRAPGR